MKLSHLLGILKKEKVFDTIIPTLNLWGIYCICMLIVVPVMHMDVIMSAIFSVLIYIFWTVQKDKVKNACIKFWHEIPLKYHTIFLTLEICVIIWYAKIFSTTKINNIKTTNK